MNNTLEIALGKTKKYHKVYCGYFTPSEILALVDDGAKPTQSSSYQVEMAKENQKNGIGGRSWFYFTLGKHHPPIPNKRTIIKSPKQKELNNS